MISRYIRVFTDAIAYARSVSRQASGRYVFDNEWTMEYQSGERYVQVTIARHYMGRDGRMQTCNARRQWNAGGGDIDNQVFYWVITMCGKMGLQGVEHAD